MKQFAAFFLCTAVVLPVLAQDKTQAAEVRATASSEQVQNNDASQSSVSAAGSSVQAPNTPADAQVPGYVYDSIAKVFNGATPTEVASTPLPGVYEVLMGSEVYYLTGDGNYLMRGELYDVRSRANLTEARRSSIRMKALAQLETEELIIFKPKKTEHVVTVFTDVDCGYCAKLHSQMDEYLAAGFEIRYAAFPRAGVGSKTYDTMVSVWCAKDRQAALTDAKARRPVAPAQCANPVEKQYKLGSSAFGISGTPTLVLENGEVIPGYVPPEKLLAAFAQAGKN